MGRAAPFAGRARAARQGGGAEPTAVKQAVKQQSAAQSNLLYSILTSETMGSFVSSTGSVPVSWVRWAAERGSQMRRGLLPGFARPSQPRPTARTGAPVLSYPLQSHPQFCTRPPCCMRGPVPPALGSSPRSWGGGRAAVWGGGRGPRQRLIGFVSRQCSAGCLVWASRPGGAAGSGFDGLVCGPVRRVCSVPAARQIQLATRRAGRRANIGGSPCGRAPGKALRAKCGPLPNNLGTG